MWDWFINLMTAVLKAIADFCGDWGLAVVILTIIIRLLITPLMTKSTRASAKMQALQPKLQELQQRYQDDPQRMNEEMQKFYAENKFNPLGGCLPIIIQMPVFFALFTVARNVPADACFYNIIPSISTSTAQAVASYGWGGAIVYILFVLAFGVLTLIPMLMNMKNTPEAQRSSQLLMGVVMAVMMVWFGWSVPAAVLLYYDASAIWQVAQQKFVTQRVMDQVKAEQEAKDRERGRVIEVERREQKKRPHKKN